MMNRRKLSPSEVTCPLCRVPPGCKCTTSHFGARRTKHFVVTGYHKSRATEARRVELRVSKAVGL